MTLRELWWKIAGTPDYPPKFTPTLRLNRYTGKVYTPRSYEMALQYAQGDTVEVIAKRYNVTMERIKQCLWKQYRASQNKTQF